MTKQLKQPTLLSPSQTGQDHLDIKSPVFKPRPGWGGRIASKISRLFGFRVGIVLVTGIGVIVVGYLFMHRTLQSAREESTEQIRKLLESAGNQPAEETLTVRTRPGQGVTHLARQALRQHLMVADIALTPEQKIYAEDYLKDRVGSRPLAVSQTVTFSPADMQQAVARALALPNDKLKNLTKYAKKVKNL